MWGAAQSQGKNHPKEFEETSHWGSFRIKNNVFIAVRVENLIIHGVYNRELFATVIEQINPFVRLI